MRLFALSPGPGEGVGAETPTVPTLSSVRGIAASSTVDMVFLCCMRTQCVLSPLTQVALVVHHDDMFPLLRNPPPFPRPQIRPIILDARVCVCVCVRVSEEEEEEVSV